MFWRIIRFFIACQQMSSTIRISMIKNAIFDPIDTNYWLANLSSIASCDSCICQCFARSSCITANYYGLRQECILFLVSLQHEQLHVMTIDKNTTVISFENRSYTETGTTENSGMSTIGSSGISTTESSAMKTTSYIAVATTYHTSSTFTTSPNISCSSYTSYAIANYTTSPTNYQQRIYNYTVLSTGIATLEFGFKAFNPVKVWYLDDVGILDSSASNIEMLVNGDFENGSLTGWQVLCSSENCGGTSGGVLAQKECYTGSYCYEGACRGAYDFLRQSFSIITGHVYMLTFWLFTTGHHMEAAYVTIRSLVSAFSPIS